MKIIMRMHITVYDAMRRDLHRSHAFAAERVGFLSARFADVDDGDKLMLATGYYPVKDEHYVRDDDVGARIDGNAIREAMQRILVSGESALHVHIHPDSFPIGFSRSDAKGYAGLVPSLMRVGRDQPHGAMVLNSMAVQAAIWLPGLDAPVISDRLSMVGFPFKLFGGADHGH